MAGACCNGGGRGGTLKFKADVKIRGIRSELLAGLMVCDDVYRDWATNSMTVTSVVDSRHSETSLHYDGAAADLRTRNVSPENWASLTAALKEALTDEFDVVLEADHIHLEFQPKRPS